MSLREKLIEAGARAIAEGPYPELSPDFMRTMRHRRAAAALDAFLDCLAENLDLWALETGGSVERWAYRDDALVTFRHDVPDLLAVLRGSVDAALARGDTREDTE